MNTGLLLVDMQNDYFPGGKGVTSPIAASHFIHAQDLWKHALKLFLATFSRAA